MEDDHLILVFKALSDPNRLAIVRALDCGEKCACELLEICAISQPTLSHHMKILRDCGLVHTRKLGKWSYYTLSCELLNDLKKTISKFSCLENSTH
ncbi:MAG: metalloregulator ArsR/SmtB family transcription factor [Coriobacteriia bacterium]|nr:metalloregulator ArsR/SmtB family transcription factor [Coriobacteriia bacterium]